MGYTVVPYVNPGDSWSASQHNTYIRDNFLALWPYTSANDIGLSTINNTVENIPIGNNDELLTIINNEPYWANLKSIYCYLGLSGATVLNATWTKISFDTVNKNILNMFDFNYPTKIYAPQTGIYNLYGGIYWASNSSATREIKYYNSYANQEYYIDTQQGIDTNTNNISIPIYLTAGSYIELQIYQGSGGNLDVSANISMIYWGS